MREIFDLMEIPFKIMDSVAYYDFNTNKYIMLNKKQEYTHIKYYYIISVGNMENVFLNKEPGYIKSTTLLKKK